MNRAVASSLLISIASLALTTVAVAQNANPTPPTIPLGPQSATLNTPPVVTPESQEQTALHTLAQIEMRLTTNACPVGLRAQPGVGPIMMTIDASAGGGSQTLTLDLSNLGSRNISHAELTVHGLTAHGRITSAVYGNPDAGTSAKQVDLALTVPSGANTSTNLLFNGFTSIRWIDLDSLTYADGSAWHSSPQHSCQIVPSRFMPVASH